MLQLRLAREVPVVGARRLQLYGEIERVIADALEAELGPDEQLAAQLAAAALVAAVRTAEETAAARMERNKRALTGARSTLSSTTPSSSPRRAYQPSPCADRLRARRERRRSPAPVRRMSTSAHLVAVSPALRNDSENT